MAYQFQTDHQPPGPLVWTDRRAERARADADRLQAQAALETARAAADAQRMKAEQDAADQAAKRKDQGRKTKRAERAESREARATKLSAALARIVRWLPTLAGLVACVAPTVIAFRGQYEFAQGPMQLGALAWLFPAMLEGAAWTLAWKRYAAIGNGEPAGRLTVGVWALALTAAAMNVWHGATTEGGSLQVGVGYGLASLVGFALVELLAGHTRAARAVRRRVGLVRALRYPRIAFAARSRMVALGPGADPDEAWRQAWLDRYGVAPSASGTERRAGRVAVRAANKAMRRGELVLTAVEAAADEDVEEGLFVLDPPDFDTAGEDEPLSEGDVDARDGDEGDGNQSGSAGADEWGDAFIDELLERAAGDLDEQARWELRDELMRLAFEANLPIERRVAVVEAAELAAGRQTPGRRRIADLLGLGSDYPVRVVLERRAREQDNGGTDRGQEVRS